MSDQKESLFHNRPIFEGEYGKLSKIEEELDEAKEAAEQGIDLMVLIELSDIIGAVAGVVEQQYGMTLDDLVQFSEKVRAIKAQKEEEGE